MFRQISPFVTTHLGEERRYYKPDFTVAHTTYINSSLPQIVPGPMTYCSVLVSPSGQTESHRWLYWIEHSMGTQLSGTYDSHASQPEISGGVKTFLDGYTCPTRRFLPQ